MTSLRHIHRLQVRCASPDDAQHGRILLEDALRTAALRDEDRLIIVRRLDMGALSARASATEWSLRLEIRFRGTEPVAVRFDHDAADNSEAVYFSDQHEPWLQLAERTAMGRPCVEWYWRPALPGWRQEMSPRDTLRLCFAALAAAGGLRLTLLLAARLDEHRALPSLLESLEIEDLDRIRGELNISATSFENGADLNTEPPFPPLTREEMALVTLWGESDPRTYWVAAVHLARTAGQMARLVPDVNAASRRIHAFVRAWTVAGEATLNQHAPAPASAEPAPRAFHPPPSGRRDGYVDRELTHIGGLFFSIPLLMRAGLPAFMRKLPPSERALYPWHVLRMVGRHARAGADDPLMKLTEELPSPPPRLGRWLLAANRRARAATRMNLRQLVTRPARVSVTSTHVTVFFRPNEADICVRCAGLDIDPGWVPWLGRVIAFRFDRED